MLASLFKNNNTFINESLGIIDGLFLLFLALSGNFLAETLGCQTQELLTNNTWAKQLMTFFMVFGCVHFSESEVSHPGSKFIKALFVYFFFLLFAKMDIIPTIIVFVLLIALYVSNSYKKYYDAVFKKKGKPNKQDSFEYAETKKYMDDIQKFLMGSVIVIILAGFALYFKEKKIEYKSDFSFHKFIFGVVKCKGMK